MADLAGDHDCMTYISDLVACNVPIRNKGMIRVIQRDKVSGANRAAYGSEGRKIVLQEVYSKPLFVASCNLGGV